MPRLLRQRAATATWRGTQPVRSIPTGLAPTIAVGSGPTVRRAPALPSRLGKYLLVRLLGEGGMARVYRAKHSIMGKEVAIKTLRPEFVDCAEAHALLLREACIAGSISHPNLIDIYDFAVDPNAGPYCVMELARGEPLARVLERGPLPFSMCLDLIIEVASAAAAIHRAGFLHRDIKSENVLLSSEGDWMHAKLIDFGIAKPLGGEPGARYEGMVGTPRTMAPEQIAQDEVDERTDVWALGVLLYEMMTGRLPFPSSSRIRDELVAIVTEPPSPLPLDVTAEMRAIIGSCLSKEPEERPGSALALVERLRVARTAYLERLGPTDG